MTRGRIAQKHNIRIVEPTQEELAEAQRPPAVLTPAAKREYKRLLFLLLEQKHWRNTFSGSLALWSQEWDTWVTARKHLKEEGLVDADGKISPWVRIANQARDALVRLGPEMGLTLNGLERITRNRKTETITMTRDSWGNDLLA